MPAQIFAQSANKTNAGQPPTVDCLSKAIDRCPGHWYIQYVYLYIYISTEGEYLVTGRRWKRHGRNLYFLLTRVRVRRKSGSPQVQVRSFPLFFRLTRAVNICVNHLIKLRPRPAYFSDLHFGYLWRDLGFDNYYSNMLSFMGHYCVFTTGRMRNIFGSA